MHHSPEVQLFSDIGFLQWEPKRSVLEYMFWFPQLSWGISLLIIKLNMRIRVEGLDKNRRHFFQNFLTILNTSSWLCAYFPTLQAMILQLTCCVHISFPKKAERCKSQIFFLLDNFHTLPRLQHITTISNTGIIIMDHPTCSPELTTKSNKGIVPDPASTRTPIHELIPGMWVLTDPFRNNHLREPLPSSYHVIVVH